MSPKHDAVVVGSGPNGFGAAITLARAGCSVLLIEGKQCPGGGMRSGELTLPGYVHDHCATIFALTQASPFFRSLPLSEHGVEWVFPPAPLAHPLDGGKAVLLEHSVETTARGLGRDRRAHQMLMGPWVDRWQDLIQDLLAPLRLPAHPLTFAAFLAQAGIPASLLARTAYRSEQGQALFAGLAGHAIMPLERLATSGFGLMLGVLAHAVGWPMVKGGGQGLVDGLSSYLKSLGGELETGWMVDNIDELPPASVYLFDITPRQLLGIAGHRLPLGYRGQLERFRYGPGVCKVDYALDGPVPWSSPECALAGTVHVGGTLREIEVAERLAWKGELAERPFVLVVQQTLFDDSRAPEGKHTLWAYCHVPNGSSVDMSVAIERQIERFAPGFRERILARHVRSAVQMEAYSPNYVGGDINGGVQDVFQQFTRPVPRLVPYSTPLSKVFLCSSSTPPGGGVHGMCGYHAAQAALKVL